MAPKMKENEDPMFGNVSRQLLLSRKVKASRPAKMDFLRKNVQKPRANKHEALFVEDAFHIVFCIGFCAWTS